MKFFSFNLIGTLLIFFSGNVFSEFVKPESMTKIQVSSTDTNRFHCNDGEINNVYYSEEKGMVDEIAGEDLYIKFQIKKVGDDILYTDKASELFVVCAGEVYQMILVPKVSNARVIYLSNPLKNRVKSNIDNYGALPLEERIIKLSVASLSNDISILDTFTVINHKSDDQDWFDFNESLRIGKIQTVLTDGLGLRVSKFRLISDKDKKYLPSDFLDTRLGESIVGVTLDPEVLIENEPSYLIIVEKEINYEL